MDHFSDMSFVHLVKDMTVESTIKAREAFVRFCGQHGVKLSHMHADNGRFADATFVASVQQDGHTITFAGVGAHHQNGRAEKRICLLYTSPSPRDGATSRMPSSA